MATTRSSQGSTKSSPAPATKAGRKRSAEPPPSPAAKRGRRSKKAKEQKTIEETMNSMEDNKEVAKQINGDAKGGEDTPIEAIESHEQENKECEGASAEKAD